MRRLAICILILALALSIAVPVLAQDPGTANVNFTVMNLDPTEDATVIAQYVNQDGMVDAAVEKTLPPLTPAGFPIADSGLPDGWIGSVVVSSDKEITAFGQILWTGGTSTDGTTAGAYNGFSQSATTLYFMPDLVQRWNQFSRITVQAASAPDGDSIEVYLNFYDREGNPSTVNPVTGSIEPGSQETWKLGTDIIVSPEDWNGSCVITATGGIAAVATSHWPEYSAAYSAVPSGGQKAYLPSATRRYINGEWIQFTGVVVQNMKDADVDVTVYWYDRGGNLLGSFMDTIPARSAHGYNTRWGSAGSDIPDTFDVEAVLGNDWNGSVVIEAANPTDEIVAMAKLQWAKANRAGAYYSEPGGYSELFAPATFRRVSDGTWLQYTGLIVQNVGDSTCTFTVTWTDRLGNDLLTFEDTLEPCIAHGYNTRWGSAGSDIPPTANVEDLGDDFRGSVHIVAPGCQLIAIHNTLWDIQGANTTYNVYGK